MPDVEQRLHADAERGQAIPDFAQALGVACQDRRSRQRPVVWAAVAAAVVLVAGAAVAVPSLRGTDHRPQQVRPVGTGAKSGLVAGAITDATSNAPRQLVLILRQHAPGCRTYRLVTTETRSQVRVRLRLTHPSDPALGAPAQRIEIPTAGSALGHPGRDLRPAGALEPICITGPYTAAGAQLRRPVGNREVIFAGSAVPVLERSAPVPGYLPVGFARPSPTFYRDPLSSANLSFDPGSLAPLAVGHYLEDGPGHSLEILTAVSDSVVPGAHTVGHESVRRHRATVTEHDSTRCVTWLAKPGDGVQVCSKAGRTVAALPTATLVRVARSIPE